MADSEAKKLYEMFRDTGDLSNFLPKASGDWSKDKDRFIKIYNKNQDLI